MNPMIINEIISFYILWRMTWIVIMFKGILGFYVMFRIFD